MSRFEQWETVDLKAGVQRFSVEGGFFVKDVLGNRLGITVTDGKQPVALTGTIKGIAKLPPVNNDSVEVFEFNGVIDQNDTSKAYVDLPEECYFRSGPMTVSIRNIDGNNKTVLAKFVGYVDAATDGEVGTPTPGGGGGGYTIDDVPTSGSNNLVKSGGVYSAISTVSSSVGSIGATVSSLENDVSNVESRLNDVESSVDTSIETLTGLVDDAEDDIGNLQSGLSTAQSNITSLTTRIGTAETGITGLGTRMGTAETDIDGLDTRVTALENSGGGGGTYVIDDVPTANSNNLVKSGGVYSAINTVSSSVSSLTSRVSAAETDIGTLSTDLTAAQGNISSLTTRVGAAETGITGLTTRTGTAETNITGLDTRVTALENASGGGATEDISSDMHVYKESGNVSITSEDCTAYRYGNVIMVTVTVKTTASISAGREACKLSIDGIPLPVSPSRSVSYYGEGCFVGHLSNSTSTYNLSIQNIAATCATNITVGLTFIYLVMPEEP